MGRDPYRLTFALHAVCLVQRFGLSQASIWNNISATRVGFCSGSEVAAICLREYIVAYLVCIVVSGLDTIVTDYEKLRLILH